MTLVDCESFLTSSSSHSFRFLSGVKFFGPSVLLLFCFVVVCLFVCFCFVFCEVFGLCEPMELAKKIVGSLRPLCPHSYK